MPHASRTIVIVGAGFSGTAVAINLLRLARAEPLRITLVDRTRVARGAAYARSEYPHLLNVPAGRMSASSADPAEFLAFAQCRLPDTTAEDFLPRELYGDYLESVLKAAELGSPPHVRLERVYGHASRIEQGCDDGSPIHVHLVDGRRLTGNDVVLALGNPAPARLPGVEALWGFPRYIENPWIAPPAFHPGETVLVVGTGLTMADIVLAGNRASPSAVVHAISRHGLVPPSQTAFRHTPVEGDARTLLSAAPLSMRRLFGWVRALSEDLEHRGGDWREAITLVRNIAPALWQRLSMDERRRFLRHVRCYWDIHRHRLADRTAAALDELRRHEKLHIHAGHIVRLELAGGRIRVDWRARGKEPLSTLWVDQVVNCAGPDYDARRSRDPLLRSLLSEGLAAADGLGLGLRTGAQGALVDSRGVASGHLFYIGPMLRADHWETTAVQELRGYAERLACHLLTAARARPRLERPLAHEMPGRPLPAFTVPR